MPTRPLSHYERQRQQQGLPGRADDRRSASARGYDRRWRQLRDYHLTQEPFCRICSQLGRVTLAVLVDHIKPVTQAPHLRLAPDNLRSLCVEHHGLITGRWCREGVNEMPPSQPVPKDQRQ
jgi:5-methylcytosine-specific restriction endonuclease McrA